MSEFSINKLIKKIKSDFKIYNINNSGDLVDFILLENPLKK
jgi:hypothetical protein